MQLQWQESPGDEERVSMETVQLQCGSCNKLMAISTQHLGGQVRCPHCQAVVQAPPRPQPAAAPAPAPPLDIMPPAQVETGEVESIFSPAEPSEDLFDAGPQRPLVEMPPEPRPDAPPPMLLDYESPTVEAPRPQQHELTDAAPPPADTSALPWTTHAPASTEVAAPEANAELAAFQRPQRPVDRGYMSLMMLIFFVPYSIMMTLFVIYLWHQLASSPHPLDMIPDPVPKKDGAQKVERIKHDQPLAKHQKVPLNATIRIGEVEVTPKKIMRGIFGDLELVLHAKNVSADQAFSPMHPDFLKAQGNALPYTFLDSKVYQRLYGGHLAFERGADGGTTGEGELKPGQGEDVVITTRDNKEVVKKILESNDDLTWRVQLRRGLVLYRGQRVSTTAVIGVVFNAKDIEKGS
jgi:hypothetical protein